MEIAIRGMRELVQILKGKEIIRAEDVERIPPPPTNAEEGAKAIRELSLYFFVRDRLSPGAYDAIEKWLESPSQYAFPRAYAELVRGLFERGALSDPDLESLLSPEGVRRIPYLPELARAQLREQVKRELLEQIKADGWASPNVVPKWLSRLKIYGDVRYRIERALFPAGNANGGEFPDWNAINAGSGFDVNFVDVANERYVNVDQDRSRNRLRARLELDADLSPYALAGFRIVSGENGSPVSTNQTLGANGGAFSKYPLWFDRAFLRLEWNRKEPTGGGVDLGKFQNPFVENELMWSENVQFDGVALRARGRQGEPLALFGAAGAFPVYNTPFAFPAERTDKFPSHDKWLYAGQVRAEWRPKGRSHSVAAALSYYHFTGIDGRISSPCDTHIKNITCDTDDTRPSFAQKGNTYMPLRTPSAAALAAEAASGVTSRYQYFGLVNRFQDVMGAARVDWEIEPALQMGLDGEVAWNAAFSHARSEDLGLNNRDRCDGSGCSRFAGGAHAFMIRYSIGTQRKDRQGDWSATISYRYLESDSVPDAWTDPDFGLGGTNLKGYYLTATYCVLDGVSAALKWTSADEIAGPPFRSDVLQLDLTARF
jgi:hypothetical protein